MKTLSFFILSFGLLLSGCSSVKDENTQNTVQNQNVSNAVVRSTPANPVPTTNTATTPLANKTAPVKITKASPERRAETGATCWIWTWEMKDGRKEEAILQLSPDKKAALSKDNLSGTWRSEGNTYYIDWGRGAGKEDKLTLTGDSLSGANFETKWIKGVKTSCL
jgi:hypothetical protein